MPLKDLLAICDPPQNPVDRPTAQDWKELEVGMGLELPQDYKEFLDRFGTGAFGAFDEIEEDAFFDLLFTVSPGTTRHELGALSMIPPMTEAIAEFKRRWPDRVPGDVYPEAGGLLYVGGTTTRHDLFWKTGGPPEGWTCLIGDNYCDNWFDFEADLTTSLAAIVAGDVPDWVIAGPSSFPLVFLDIETLDHTPLV